MALLSWVFLISLYAHFAERIWIDTSFVPRVAAIPRGRGRCVPGRGVPLYGRGAAATDPPAQPIAATPLNPMTLKHSTFNREATMTS